MKKLILTVATFISLANVNFAQENKTDFRDKFQFGFKAGSNYSNVYDSQGEAFRANGKFGFAAGAFITIPFGKYFGIQPEIQFSQKGFQATGIILNNTYNFTRTTNYLDFPILFSVKPSEFITLQCGPQYSYLLSQTDAFATASTSIEQQQQFVHDNVRKNTLCFVAGFDTNLKHLVLGARIGWDVLNNNGDGTSSTPRYKNYWLQGTIGYRFYTKD